MTLPAPAGGWPVGAWGGVLQGACLTSAFWLAVFVYRSTRPDGRDAVRFVLGLALGAVLTRVGWVWLHGAPLRSLPAALLQPDVGSTVLFQPLGLLAVAPRRRGRFLADSLGSLPAALAVARLGCLFAGCCTGRPGDVPWALLSPGAPASLHPVVLYEVAGWLVLHAAACRSAWRGAAPAFRVALFLVGFGALRLAIEPFRAAPSDAAACLALAWTCAGALAACAGALAAAETRSRPR